MDTDYSVTLLRDLLGGVCRWQTAVCRRRSTKTVEKRVRAQVVKLFVELTGKNPTPEQVDDILIDCGLI